MSDAHPAHRCERRLRRLASTIFWTFVLANVGLIVWLWIHNHNLRGIDTNTATLVTRIGGITGLLGAYLALVQVLLLARLPWLERVAGFDRRSVWHRWNGHLCIDLIIAHVVLSVWGYAAGAHHSILYELWGLLAQNFLTGMVTATAGTVLLLVVIGTSIVIVRRRLPYEVWYGIHFATYAGIALAWFHQIPTGGDLNPANLAGPPSPEGVLGQPVHWPSQYWQGLFYGTIALVALRVLLPLFHLWRYRLRIAEVTPEGPYAVSIRITGRDLDRLRAQPGQFFIWRFLAAGHWWSAHPFSLSAAPDGESLRITARAAGDHTRRMPALAVGTRVMADGPFGSFTDAARSRDSVLLIAGGIGITPIRALAEEMQADIVLIHRVASTEHIVFADEIAELAARRGITVHYVVGDHAAGEGRDLLSPTHLLELVPDLAEREVFLCGPPAMIEAIDSALHHAHLPRRHLHVERFAL
ncbi:MAG: ferric reductase-like transmembrane domain-containing protein [Actinomycetes bacterium]